ncbi:MAG: homogentisate 1,2-dioxygenase [Oligoflexales bacterium]|nr:homogentisate 1,2-dioxygenase [Oligoflexales bacterium]
MLIPHVKGPVAEQAHVGVPDGLYEEEFARDGFYGRYAHLYRSQSPVGWTRIEGELRPRAYELRKTPQLAETYPQSRSTYLYNDDVSIQFAEIHKPMSSFFRNADGDDICFVHEGEGTLRSDFGPLEYKKGDYLVIPRGTVQQWLPRSKTLLLIVESFSEVRIPDRGPLGQHAIFDPAVVKTPHPKEDRGDSPQSEYELIIKRAGELTRVYYPFSPINTVGWKGTLCTWQINVADIRPITCERYHLPPSAHTTFIAKNFVICSFLPRALETGDPKAVKVPFYHSNIDYDEVLFYHSGDFFSRAGIKEGMITFHPQGIHHGPHPQAVEKSKNLQRTDEIAVMIDTKRPLLIDNSAAKTEIKEYWQSWQVGHKA